jgi:hypothetical protein
MCLIFATYESQALGAIFSDSLSLYQDLFRNYTSELRPQSNLSESTEIGMKVILFSLNDLDEVTGMVSLVVGVVMTWNDFRLSWNPSSYGGLTTITLPKKILWVPNIFLLDPANKMEAIGSDDFIGRVESDGTVYWSPGGLIQSLCDVNMHKFPFDTQECGLVLALWGYLETEAKLVPLHNSASVDTSYYSKNGQWDLEDATLFSFTLGGKSTGMKITLTLKRKSLYFVFNMLVPILLLSILNPLVFVLPVDSGERLSYAITIFLSFAVFMTLLSDNMPKSSEPMALMSYFLMETMCMSTIAILLTVFTLCLHFKESDTEVSKKLLYLLRFLQLRFLFSCCTKTKTESNKVAENKVGDDTFMTKNKEMEYSDDIMDWKTLAKGYDKVLTHYFYTFIFFQWILFCILLLT